MERKQNIVLLKDLNPTGRFLPDEALEDVQTVRMCGKYNASVSCALDCEPGMIWGKIREA